MSRRLLLSVILLSLVTGAYFFYGRSGADGDTEPGFVSEATDESAPDGTPGPGSNPQSSVDPAVTPTAIPTPVLIPEDAIIVGAIVDKTGIMRRLDEPALEAARIQIGRVNAAGGVLGRPLVLKEFDSRSQLNASFQAAQELIEDGIELLLVTCEYQFAKPAIDIATAAGVLVLSPCGGTSEWGVPAVAGRNVFSFAMPSTLEGKLMAEFVLAEKGPLVTLIVDKQDPDAFAQCEGFQDEFVANGGSFRGRLEVTLENVVELEEMLSTLLRTSFSTPNAVVLCASPAVGQDVVLYLRRAGLESPIVAGSTMDGDSWIVNVERTGSMQVLSYASVYGDDPDPAIRELFAEYETLTGAAPAQGRPVTGADAIAAFALAAERAGSLDLNDLIAELEQFDAQPLVAGTITFNENSHLSTRSMRLIEIVDDQPAFERIIEPEA
ncbi:MAG: ABC transporter substrate-binding protein [Acidimicrobiales bacterium]